MKKRIGRYGMYLVTIAAGAAVTPAAIRYATNWRGYTAIGGEFLIIPLLTLAVYFIQGITETIKTFWKGE
jgi:hypothetical protein